MSLILDTVALLSACGLVATIACQRRLVTGMTLGYSWLWLLVASLNVLVTSTAAIKLIVASPGLLSAMQLLTVVLLLTPPVSTLGARLPGAGAWQAFVVVPLILVLMWPATIQLLNSQGREPLDLGIPALGGILLVLMMSSGTCLGTRMTAAGFLYLAAIAALMLPLGSLVAPDSWIVKLCPVLLFASISVAGRIMKMRLEALDQSLELPEILDNCWLLFQDFYGLVWARRVQDRVNQFSSREQWSVVLTPSGFRDSAGNPACPAELEKPREAFRWVLSRFADETWLQARLYRLG